MEELISYIKELEDLLEEERNINEDNESEFEKLKKQNSDLKKIEL